jgi:hypothetical protein
MVQGLGVFVTLIDGHRQGITYSPTLDFHRLNKQANRVFQLMMDGCWRTLAEISFATGDAESSISARLRDLRKDQFGGSIVKRKRRTIGQYEYQLIPSQIARIVNLELGDN